MPLNDHFGALLAKLHPHTDTIRDFLARADADGVIPVHRIFSAGAEDDDIIEPGRVIGEAERLRGQHPLLGFVLDHNLIDFAAHTRVVFDFDEYGDEYI